MRRNWENWGCTKNTDGMIHKPVLLKEVLEIFTPESGQMYVDATINGGGHAEAILEKIGSKGKLLGIDWDQELIDKLKVSARGGSAFDGKSEKLKVTNLILICDNYANLKSIAREYNLAAVNGILFDLGFSSHHLEESHRGFSFLKNEPLDMRYNQFSHELTAEKIINIWSVGAIEDILRRFGEERYSGRIARAIVRERFRKKISTSAELVKIISENIPRGYLRGKIHPATRTFQALRMAVNHELENLEKGLHGSLKMLAKGGKVVVISFHSLEDRVVKNFFRAETKRGTLVTLTPKPIRPDSQEVAVNPKARSAKLRAAQKT